MTLQDNRIGDEIVVSFTKDGNTEQVKGEITGTEPNGDILFETDDGRTILTAPDDILCRAE